MTKEQIEKSDKLRQGLKIVEDYLKAFSPNSWVNCLQVEKEGVQRQDHHGNKGAYLKLYAHTNEESEALGYEYNNMCKLFRKYLEDCTADLTKRKEELEHQLKEL